MRILNSIRQEFSVSWLQVFFLIFTSGSPVCIGGEWSTFVEKDPELEEVRLSTEGRFSKDRDLGILFLADPSHVRQTGARQFHIWHEESSDYTFYLRVAGSRDELSSRPFLFFRNPPERIDAPGDLAGLGYFYNWAGRPQLNEIDTNLETYDYYQEDLYYAYNTERYYLGPRASRMREFLLKTRYNIEANFVYDNGATRRSKPKMFVVKSDRGSSGALKESVGFVFDADPFGFAYRIPQRNRIAAHLANPSGVSYYQWVKVGGKDGVAYGNIHEFALPRPVNIGVIGDSYSSGEGARATAMIPSLESGWHGLNGFPLGWITEYADWEESYSHRSLASGWERAVCQQNRQKFASVALNFYNVSTSGAVARRFGKKWNLDEFDVDVDLSSLNPLQLKNYREWFKCAVGYECPDVLTITLPSNNPDAGVPIDEDSVRHSGTILGGGLGTASRQLHLLDDLLEMDGYSTLDVLGFTFGGNDASFSNIITSLLMLQLSDREIRGSIGGTLPFFNDLPEATSLNDLRDIGRNNLQYIGEKLKNDDFGFRVKKVIRGNYCNPLGDSRSYQPRILVNSDWAYLLNVLPNVSYSDGELTSSYFRVDEQETNSVRSSVLNMMQDELVGFDASRFGYNLADTRQATIESNGFPTEHGHSVAAADSWFVPLNKVGGEDTQMAFHPNAKGHNNIYRPIYNEKLSECLKPENRRMSFDGEGFADLLNWSTSITYENGELLAKVVAGNLGTVPTIPAYVNLGVIFGAGEGVYHSDVVSGARGGAFTQPLLGEDGFAIVVPTLLPNELWSETFKLASGERECVYYDLIIDHFFRVQDRAFKEGLVGDVSGDTLLGRAAAFIPLFGNRLTLHCDLKPVSVAGSQEINFMNNRGASFPLPFDPDLSSMFNWLAKTRREAYERLLEKMFPGVDPAKIDDLFLANFYENPKRVTDTFNVQTLDVAGLNREDLKLGQVVSVDVFREAVKTIDHGLKNGIIGAKPVIFDSDIFDDYLVVSLRGFEKRIGFDRWGELPLILPADASLTDARYCRYRSSPKGDGEYEDIPIKIGTRKKLDSLKRYGSNDLIRNQILNLQVEYTERPKGVEIISQVTVKDPVTEALFEIYALEPRNNEESLDLSEFLFHSDQVEVGVSAVNRSAEDNRYFLEHGNPSQIDQRSIGRDGISVMMELIIEGPFASSLSDEVIIEITGDANLTIPLEVVSVGGGNDGKLIELRVPIYLLYGQPKIIKISNKNNPSISKISSIGVRETHQVTRDVEVRGPYDAQASNDFSKGVGFINNATDSITTVDASSDLKGWSREVTELGKGGERQSVKLSGNREKKRFFRVQKYEILER